MVVQHDELAVPPDARPTITVSVQRTSNTSHYDDTDDSRATANLLALSYEKHWELSERNSGAIVGQGEVARIAYDFRYVSPPTYDVHAHGTRTHDFESVMLVFSHSFFDNRQTRAVGDSWLEVGAGFKHQSDYYRYIVAQPPQLLYTPRTDRP